MARVSDGVLPEFSQLGLTLDRYQELMGLPICAFNGVNYGGESHDSSCLDIVNQSQRDTLAMYLLQAEEIREEELGYFLTPKWRVEEHEVGRDNPFILEKKYLVEVGWPTWALLSEDEAIDFGTGPFSTDNPPNDPITITLATTVSVYDIAVTYPDEKVLIHPSSVTSSGGVVTIKIPRCRLVDPAYNDDREDPLDYYGDYFLDTVDIYCYYADPQYGAEFKWIQPNCDTDCEPNCQPACAIVSGARAYELSIVRLFPATYSSGAWTRTNCFSYSQKPDSARITYKSGRRPSLANELYTIRLAHTLMPRPPCSCDIVKQKWERDRTPAEGGQFSAYGSTVGAIEVWMADSRARVGQGGMF